MGSSKSKFCILSYEEAEKRISEKEINRLKRAFNQCSSKKTLSFDKFCTEVFGSFLPNIVAEIIFKALNTNNNSTGINFKELLVGLVILTKGTYEEKCKFFYSLYCNESGSGIDLPFMQYAADKTTTKEDISSIKNYLDENSTLSLDNFTIWIKDHPKFNELSRWLLTEDFKAPILTDDSIPQDIYQLVAGVTHLNELEIMGLEKTYYRLMDNLSNQLNINSFTKLVCPPLPECIIERVFQTFDENNDGIIDFNELAFGISACCRGPKIERKKFCCKIFNKTMDGRFDPNDIENLFKICEETKNNESNGKYKRKCTLYSDLMKSILNSKEMLTKNYITIDDLLIWINDNRFVDPFLNLMNQICVITFGLKPKNSLEEELVIKQYLQREQSAKIISYDHLYLISKAWLNHWVDSMHFSNSTKDDSYKGSPTRSIHSNSRISHSISMNNSFVFNKKHQYDLTKLNKSCVLENSKDNHTGRFIYHTSLNGDDDEIVENIYPDLYILNDQFNCFGDSSNSIGSLSSNNSLHDFSKSQHLGPITNQILISNQSSNLKLNPNLITLTDDGGILSPNIKFNEDFELLPPPIWNCFHSWYGADIAIRRPIWIDENISQTKPDEGELEDYYIVFKRFQSSVKVEIQLLTLFIMRHMIPNTTTNINGLTSSNQLTISSNGVLSGGSIHPYKETIYRDIQTAKRHISYRASFGHMTRITELIEFLSQKMRINREEMRIWKVINENNIVLLDDEEKCLQECGLQNFDKILVEQRNIDLTWPEELNQLVTLKALNNRSASISRGITGLSNIGNTCFLNSAIQCISNTTILTDYFIRDIHLYEINKNNPQGSQGIIALRYGELIKQIWTGTTNLIVPLKLKMTLDKYSKQFCGNQQHDAQELLSVLLDALHEDLNRVDVKPSYKKLKDSDGRLDEEVAQEAWEAHIETNFSIIVDLFHGLFKSNVCCDICKSNSVRFDVFSMLSLPIPMQLNKDFEILVFKTNSAIPSKHCVLFNILESTALYICEQLSKQLSISVSSIVLVLVEDKKIKKFLTNSDKIFFTQTLYAYIFDLEVTSNGTNSETILETYHEKFVKFVIYRRKLTQKINYFLAQSKQTSELFGYPIILLIKKDDLMKLTNQNLHDKIIQILENQFNDTNIGINFLNTIKNHSSKSLKKLNHAVDCDSNNKRPLFSLTQISLNADRCSICHWTSFCQGCPLPINSDIYNTVGLFQCEEYLCIDWGLNLSFLSSQHDKKFIFDENYQISKFEINQPMNLIQCIESFTNQETLDFDTLYQCYKCKKPQPAHKKLDLWTLPPILIIHLKRFQFVDKTWQKSHKTVLYPIRNLDLRKFVERDKNNNLKSLTTTNSNHDGENQSTNNHGVYNLYAVNCHIGNLQRGHYVTYARNKETDKWYLFNDSICKEVNEKEISTNCAYLLFYERVDLESNEFLNQVLSKVPHSIPHAVEIISDEVESDIKKYCVLQ